MKAVVIRHVAFESLGNIEQHLINRNFDIEIMNAAQNKVTHLLGNQPDLLIILGGPISVNDIEDYPFIADELEVLRQRLTLGLPTLGICLGGQLIAKALGASVHQNNSKEIGWGPLTTIKNVDYCPAIRHLSAENTNVLHWHGETFDIPAGAVHLASTTKCKNQAFVFQGNTLALQFHPEATASDLEDWFVGHTAEITSTDGLSVTQLRRETRENADTLNEAAQSFWSEWFDSITSSQKAQVAYT